VYGQYGKLTWFSVSVLLFDARKPVTFINVSSIAKLGLVSLGHTLSLNRMPSVHLFKAKRKPISVTIPEVVSSSNILTNQSAGYNLQMEP